MSQMSCWTFFFFFFFLWEICIFIRLDVTALCWLIRSGLCFILHLWSVTGWCRPDVIQSIYTSRLEITNSQNYATTHCYLLKLHSGRRTMKKKFKKSNFYPCSNFSQVKKSCLNCRFCTPAVSLMLKIVHFVKKHKHTHTHEKTILKIMFVLMYILLFSSETCLW